MSYIVSIRRDKGPPISRDEALAIAESEGLRVDPSTRAANELRFFCTDATGEFALLHLEGRIESSTTPSNDVLVTMQRIARRLDARLIGEEGEDLTDAEQPEDVPEITPVRVWGCIALLVLLIAAVAWWLL